MTAPRANRDLSLSGMKTPRWGLTEQHPKPGVPWHGEPRTRHPWGAARTRGPPRGRGRALGTDRPVAGACRANRGQDILVHTWGWFPATPTWHTGIVGAGRDAPPPPPCPPCCVLAPKQLYRERHLNPTGDVLGCSNTPRASCKAGGHRGLGVGAGTRRPAELCLRQRARGCADPMEMGAPCPAGHMCRRGVGLTPLGGGGGDEQHPTPQGLSPCPPPRDSLLRHRRLLPPVHGGDLSPGHGSPNTQPWLCHAGGRPTLGSKQRRFPGGRRRGGSQAQPVLLPPPPPQGQVSPVLPAPLVCAAAAERHASRPRPPPPPPPLRRRPRRAAAIPRHAGEGNIARCTRESFVEVPAGMGTPASPAESQAEVPAWHGGPWPPATPA